jgi:hypothetical protein
VEDDARDLLGGAPAFWDRGVHFPTDGLPWVMPLAGQFRGDLPAPRGLRSARAYQRSWQPLGPTPLRHTGADFFTLDGTYSL